MTRKLWRLPRKVRRMRCLHQTLRKPKREKKGRRKAKKALWKTMRTKRPTGTAKDKTKRRARTQISLQSTWIAALKSEWRLLDPGLKLFRKVPSQSTCNKNGKKWKNVSMHGWQSTQRSCRRDSFNAGKIGRAHV